jgi:dTDP-4-amino-4,6-dideoxygalactose transaminase
MGFMIPYYQLSSIHQPIRQQLIDAAVSVIDSGNFVFGTTAIENAWSNYTGASHCIAVSNGTTALHLALLALGVGPGDEVITVSHTFKATVAAILYCGATPVFVDIDPDTFVMDINLVSSAITSKTKAVLPVHLYGNAVDMPALMSVCKQHNLAIIEDCSQAHGTKINGQHVGTFGDIGTFSFYPGKGIGALGDAGAVITNKKELADLMKLERTWKDDSIGYNYRMSNIQSEFLAIKVQHWSELLEQKQKIAKDYDESFKSAVVRPGVEHSYHIYPVLVKDRAGLFNACANNIELKCHYPLPVHRLPAYLDNINLPVTDYVSSHQISLPIYPGVDFKQVTRLLYDKFSSFL